MKRTIVATSGPHTLGNSSSYIDTHRRYKIKCKKIAIDFSADPYNTYTIKLRGEEDRIENFLDFLRQNYFKIVETNQK